MTIEFGIFDHIEFYDGGSAEAVYDERIAFLKRAEEGGFYAFHLAEHHGHGLSISPSPTVFLAALARETTRMKLIPTVVCLPLHDPVRIFEELAMLDVLSHGRLEIGVGKGITAFEHLMFGHPPEEGSARAQEMLGMLLKAWETGIMSSEGSEFFDFLELQLPFTPVQHPYPPIWTAGNVEAAGSRGHNFIFPAPISAELRARYDELRAESREQPGHHNPHVAEPRVAQCTALVIGKSDEEAKDIARRRWGRYMEAMMRARGNVPPHLQTSVPELDNPFAREMLTGDPLEKGLLVAGSVDTVRDHYVERAKSGTTNYFILMVPIGDMTKQELDYTVDSFIAEVMPAVREVETAAAPS